MLRKNIFIRKIILLFVMMILSAKNAYALSSDYNLSCSNLQETAQVWDLQLEFMKEELGEDFFRESVRERVFDDKTLEIMKKAGENPLASRALSLIGTPYVYAGADTSGFDCSGFVQYVFGKSGIQLPHSSFDMASLGVSVKKEDLMIGDGVFFDTLSSFDDIENKNKAPKSADENNDKPRPDFEIKNAKVSRGFDGDNAKRASHVGIYIGGGRFVHASTYYGQVTVDDLGADYYKRRYLFARRFIL